MKTTADVAVFSTLVAKEAFPIHLVGALMPTKYLISVLRAFLTPALLLLGLSHVCAQPLTAPAIAWWQASALYWPGTSLMEWPHGPGPQGSDRTALDACRSGIEVWKITQRPVSVKFDGMEASPGMDGYKCMCSGIDIWGNEFKGAYCNHAVRNYWCPQGYNADPISRTCQAWAIPDKNKGCKGCPEGNPVNVAYGNKFQVEHDLPGWKFSRAYNSLGSQAGAVASKSNWGRTGAQMLCEGIYYDSGQAPCKDVVEVAPSAAIPAIDVGWKHSFERRLTTTSSPLMNAVTIENADGSTSDFVYRAGEWQPFPGEKGNRLINLVGANELTSGWIRMSTATNEMEVYNSSGQLLSTHDASGGSFAIARNAAGKVESITDKFDRRLTLSYDSEGRLEHVSPNEGVVVGYKYAGGLLSEVVYPDGTSRSFKYVQDTSALSSIVDEGGAKFAEWTYSSGMPISSTHAGGASKVTVKYATGKSATVTTAAGATRKYDLQLVANVVRPVSVTESCGVSCSRTKYFTYDAYGNTTSYVNFNGQKSCFAYESTRHFEKVRVEGLTSQEDCAAFIADMVTLVGARRKITTQYHPLWKLSIKTAEPRRIVTKVYNGQPDPFTGETAVWCAPSSASLPNNIPIAVLCKQVEQGTLDGNGSKGFAAEFDGSIRVQQWTYNERGQVITSENPLGKVTKNTYYSEATADHSTGDLATVTNALGQVVASYTKYNHEGQWLEMLDANGIATTRTFDLRQRLKTITTAGLTTSYDYWPTGLLKKVTLPDATFVSYDYDDAHRLIAVTDNLGNKVSYTLDNSGNRTGETVTDPSGKLARTLTRVPDALGRIQQVTGRE